MSSIAPFDPKRLIVTLAHHHVRYILVGAVAARLQGFPRLTAAADITPARDEENLKNLATALRDLDARVYTEFLPEGLAFDCSATTLARADFWSLVTAAGRLNVIFEPAGTKGFDDLSRDAIAFEVFGVRVDAASLTDIVRSKVASDRLQDQQDVVVLREMMRKGEP